MANIMKISGYYIDPNGNYSTADVRIELQSLDLISHHIEVKEADIGEWEDSSVLNRHDCPLVECEKYFGIAGTFKPAPLDILDIKTAIKKGKLAVKITNGNILIGYPVSDEWVKIGEVS